MKKFNLKISLLSLLFLFAASVLFTGCGKDDNEGETNSASTDVAIGTFKGKGIIYYNDKAQVEYFDIVLTVSKAGDGLLTAALKSGEAYSSGTTKTFAVERTGIIVNHKTGSLQGAFVYSTDVNSLHVVTAQEAKADVKFEFKGTKQ